jgi:hypothetical protein
MTPVPDDVAGAYRKWLENEVSGLSSLRTDLGKFFFGVSSGTIGLIVGYAKTGERISLGCPIYISLTVLSFSLLAALYLVQPPHWTFSRQTDLIIEHSRQVTNLKWSEGIWFLLWFSGAAVGTWGLLKAV